MNIVGDIHGNLDFLRRRAITRPFETFLQLGDFGIGTLFLSELKNLPPNLFFFPGNHDNRTLAKTIKNCLGDFGEFQNIFFVSGAHSVDYATRNEGLNWWRDEELTYKQCEECLDAWVKSKSEIIISHDCPQSIAEHLFQINDRTRTRQLLEAMIAARKPKIICHGHHHQSLHIKWDGMEIHSLGCEEIFQLKP